MIGGGSDEYRPHIAHICGDSKTEDHHHRQRHTEEDEHRPAVTQDMPHFLDNTREKLSHVLFGHLPFDF